jgi:flagellar motor switch/type III secretory pathway protein FliN
MANTGSPPIQILNSIKSAELTLRVVLLKERFELGQLVQLSPGSMLMFADGGSTSAAVVLNDKTIAQGEVVQTGDHYGVKLSSLAP